MTYALSSQITSVDNVEFNGLSCPIIGSVSAGTKITITTTPTMTGVSKSANNEIVLSSGASYMVEASLVLFKAGASCFSVVQWYNATDSVYIGQESVIRNLDWFNANTRVCRFVCRALILASDFTGATMTIYPNTKSTNGGGAYGLSGFLSPSVQVWRIS